MTLLRNPSHPGEVLQELYLDPLELSPIALAKRLHVPRTRIERLVKGGPSPSSAAAREVLENGHGLEIAAGTKARVLGRADRGRQCRVRILEGSWSSRIVWVPSRWVW